MTTGESLTGGWVRESVLTWARSRLEDVDAGEVEEDGEQQRQSVPPPRHVFAQKNAEEAEPGEKQVYREENTVIVRRGVKCRRGHSLAGATFCRTGRK